MELSGANPGLSVSGTNQLEGKSNYIIGNDPSKWHTKVPTYAQVKYTGVYPGVDLVYYGNQGQLEYDFIVAPGADRQPMQDGATNDREWEGLSGKLRDRECWYGAVLPVRPLAIKECDQAERPYRG
jgi:hypothetical protein